MYHSLGTMPPLFPCYTWQMYSSHFISAGTIQNASVWFVFLPRSGTRKTNIWSSRLEHTLWIQRDWSAYQCSTVAYVPWRLQGMHPVNAFLQETVFKLNGISRLHFSKFEPAKQRTGRICLFSRTCNMLRWRTLLVSVITVVGSQMTETGGQYWPFLISSTVRVFLMKLTLSLPVEITSRLKKERLVG